jgi:hypothetical protein
MDSRLIEFADLTESDSIPALPGAIPCLH